MAKKPLWKKADSRKKAGKKSQKLSPARKAAGKRSAKKAGRRYPNYNMRAAAKEESQESDKALIEVLGIAGQRPRHGPLITPNGIVFNLWAPIAQSVELLERGQLPRRMSKDADG